MSNPIPVTERLPEPGENALWYHDGHWEIGEFMPPDNEGHYVPEYIADPYYEYYGDGCEQFQFLSDGVTHWMPLPPSPPQADAPQ